MMDLKKLSEELFHIVNVAWVTDDWDKLVKIIALMVVEGRLDELELAHTCDNDRHYKERKAVLESEREKLKKN